MRKREAQRIRVICQALEAFARDRSNNTFDRTEATLVLDDLAKLLNVVMIEPEYGGADQARGAAWEE